MLILLVGGIFLILAFSLFRSMFPMVTGFIGCCIGYFILFGVDAPVWPLAGVAILCVLASIAKVVTPFLPAKPQVQPITLPAFANENAKPVTVTSPARDLSEWLPIVVSIVGVALFALFVISRG